MSDYTKITDFAIKDALPDGDADKLVLGSEIDVEFNAIAVAIASKSEGSGAGSGGSGLLSSTGLAGAVTADATLLSVPVTLDASSDHCVIRICLNYSAVIEAGATIRMAIGGASFGGEIAAVTLPASASSLEIDGEGTIDCYVILPGAAATNTNIYIKADLAVESMIVLNGAASPIEIGPYAYSGTANGTSAIPGVVGTTNITVAFTNATPASSVTVQSTFVEVIAA